jgi:hypothetical protein
MFDQCNPSLRTYSLVVVLIPHFCSNIFFLQSNLENILPGRKRVEGCTAIQWGLGY